MSERHAYMIMAHHKFDILKELLVDLDDERNDIFLHIDKKAGNVDFNRICSVVKKANIYLTKRMNIHWGGYSQIQCVIMLLEEAVKQGYHSYYHFMVGVEFPLKTQEYIHKFFEKNNGYEFIGFDYDADFMYRVQYYHPFNECARNSNFFVGILNKIRIFSVNLQKKLHIDITKKYNLIFKKGSANWSITHNLACLIISKKEEIDKIYRHSFCADEVFIHTLVYNSNFWRKVYDKEDEYHSSMRMHTWNDSYNQYHINDVDYLLATGRLFARKIDGDDALEVIDRIKRGRGGEISN